ncbi:FecR family protein [Mucilaginibacter paludis]|nr:FecR family protein [Mucilaginibacter paludis]
MEVTPQLIAQFFKQECTPEESELISEYFNEHPEELDKYLSDDDWQKFTPDSKLHPVVSQQMLDVIENNISLPAKKKSFNYRLLMAAASALLFICAGAILYNRYSVSRAGKAQLAVHQHQQQVTYDTIANRTGYEISTQLTDGSVIVLSPGSEICYQKPFTRPLRNIYLTGEALFKVAKNKTRPFTVFARGLSTTALGTCFKVTAARENANVTVKLYEGKVVIKHQASALVADDHDVYLNPGQQLCWNSENGKSKLIAFDAHAMPEIKLAEKEQAKSSGIIQFNNERLWVVLDKLQQVYHIRITADSNGLKNKYFTGSVNSKTELPADVLQTIATLNKLELKKQHGAFAMMPRQNTAADTLNIR